MKIYKLQRQQLINAGIDDVWDFFSSANNLAAITPSYMNIKITSPDLLNQVYEGQVITYTLSPLLNIPISWMTEITHVVKNERFVDDQRSGPYTIWHHQHHFKETSEGVLMTDLVHYALPLGFLGGIAHTLYVRKQLHNIFEYRRIKIDELFNNKG